MSMRRSISTTNKVVNDVLDKKASMNKASAYIEETILFHLKYKDVIDKITSPEYLMNINKGGDNNVVNSISNEKKNRLKSLVK